MKKIMFNDHYGLTEDVLSGRKTMTRRIVKLSEIDALYLDEGWQIDGYVLQCFIERYAHFKVGEIVAIAQSYKDAGFRKGYYRDEDALIPLFVGDEMESDIAVSPAGWTNKMFVRADLMPHQICFNGHKFERLQDISDEDCIEEGVVEVAHKIPTEANQYITRYYPCRYLKECADKVGWGISYATPQEAFAVLIDKVFGKGTWESNPYVFAYDYELVK